MDKHIHAIMRRLGVGVGPLGLFVRNAWSEKFREDILNIGLLRLG